MKKVKYIIRLDDISWDMDYLKFNKMVEILTKYGVKPLIGVIPKNEDFKFKQLDNRMQEEEFWKLMKSLHSEHGWQIALHGYEHRYITCEPGILRINPRSEFAGIKEQEQYNKINFGKKILVNRGLKISAFMAPAHSFDSNTLKSLKKNGIYAVTDGYGIYPYMSEGIVFVPQLCAKPRKMPFGVYTFCFHTNTMDSSDFNILEDFIKDNVENIISFDEATTLIHSSIGIKCLNRFLYFFIYMLRVGKLITKKIRSIKWKKLYIRINFLV